MKSRAIICDIDGTIANIEHRLHFIQGKKNWKEFFLSMSDDIPIIENIDLVLESLENHMKLIFVSGRPDLYKQVTVDWINKNTPFRNYHIFMRKHNDYRKDTIIKEEILKKIDKNYIIECVFEDRVELKEMWEFNQIKCILVKNSH